MIYYEAKDFPPDGLEATGEDVTVTVPKGTPLRTYKLYGDKDGSIIVDGAGYGHASREGIGNGDAYRGGTGNGHASRSGKGNGDAYRGGTGNGHAYINGVKI